MKQPRSSRWPWSRVALCLAFLLCPLWPGAARADAWIREPGHFYVEVKYSFFSTDTYYNPNFELTPINRYTQHLVGFYGEVGIVHRWLMVTAEGELYRRNGIQDQGTTQGMGDFRVGVWTGLVEKPVRLALGIKVGIPIGDPAPDAGPGSDQGAQTIALSLPTGDGEWDIEGRLSLGYSFGGVRRWPLIHYVMVEAGYWLHTSFADAFVYRAQLGTKLPFAFLERFWLTLRLVGVESFASQEEASSRFVGLGNGVTYLSPQADLSGRIYRGLSAAFGFATAVRGRSIGAGYQYRVLLSYER